MDETGRTGDREPARDDLFRAEALREYARVRSEGTLVRIHPAWTGWVFWLLVATFAGGALFAVLLRVDRFLAAPPSTPAASETPVGEPRP